MKRNDKIEFLLEIPPPPVVLKWGDATEHLLPINAPIRCIYLSWWMHIVDK